MSKEKNKKIDIEAAKEEAIEEAVAADAEDSEDGEVTDDKPVNKKDKPGLTKKEALKLICITLASVLIVVITILIYHYFFYEKPVPEPKYDKLATYVDVVFEITKEDFDWDENVFEDEDYLKKNRTVFYSTGNESFVLVEGDKRLKPGADLFIGYFDAIINGDRERVNSYYASSFIEDVLSEEDESKRHPYFRSLTERFTMQRLYDMKVTFVGTPYQDDTQYIWYQVEYRLAKNNGTFLEIVGTNKSGHDVLLRQDFYLIDVDGEYKISYVGFNIEVVDEG